MKVSQSSANIAIGSTRLALGVSATVRLAPRTWHHVLGYPFNFSNVIALKNSLLQISSEAGWAMKGTTSRLTC